MKMKLLLIGIRNIFIFLIINSFLIGCSQNSNSKPGSNSDGTLISIEISPVNSTIHLGTNQQFTATGIFDNGVRDITTLVSWSSLNNSIATIGNTTGSNGLAVAINAGATIITAKLNGVSASVYLYVATGTLQSVVVSPVNPTIYLGTKQQFTATGVFSDGTQDLTTSVTWKSSNTTIATIGSIAGNNGLATAVASGTTMITASFNGLKGSSNLSVATGTLQSITVSPSNQSIYLGTNQQYTAIGIFSDGGTQNITTSVTWSSSNTTIASISNTNGKNGLAIAVSAGVVEITATFNGITSLSSSLSVATGTLQSITVSPSNQSIHLGTNQQYTATGIFSDGGTQNITTSVIWSSSNAAVATIANTTGSNGLATAVAAGSTTITATLDGVLSSKTLFVVAGILQSITISPNNSTVYVGTSQQFTATGVYSEGPNQNITTSVTWGSSNATITTISDNVGSKGLASAITAGSAIITATLDGVLASSNIFVTTGTLQSITITPANQTIQTGATQQFIATGVYTNGSQDITTSVTWSSLNSAIATISDTIGTKGLATAVASGTTTITATINSISGTTPFTVSSSTTNHYAYVPNFTSGNVSMFSIDSYGQLIALSPGIVSAGTNPYGIATAPSGQYAYVVNNGDNNVSMYTVSSNGQLNLFPTVFTTGFSPYGIAVTPSGQYAYVVNNFDNTVSMYRIASDGQLLSLSPNIIATGTSPYNISIAPSGQFAYVLNNSDNTVSMFGIDSDGQLSPLSPATIATGSNPLQMVVAVTPSGNQFAYAVNSASGDISMYSLNATNGQLAELLPNTISAGTNPYGIAVTPSGKYVYVANFGSGDVSMYSIDDTTGQLTALGTIAASGFPVGFPTGVIVSPSGQYVYVVGNATNDVSMYSIDGTTGLLTALTPAVIVTGGFGPYKISAW